MAVFSKIILSGSVGGQGIPVTGILPSTANTIHTAVTATGNAAIDEVYLYAHNTATLNRVLTLRWGATVTGIPIREMKQTIPFEDGLFLVVPGLPLNGALTVQAYATIADQVAVYGYVNRIT